MAVLIIAIIFSVPLALILGSYWVRVKQMELTVGAHNVEPRIRALEAENRVLQQRVEVLETIVTEADPARLRVRVGDVGSDDAMSVAPRATATTATQRMR